MLSTTTLSESEGLPERPSVKIEANMEPYATGLPLPGHLGHTRIEEIIATVLLIIRHLEFAFGRPTPSKVHRVYEVLWKLPHVAHGSQACTLPLFHLQSRMETLPFPFIRVAHIVEEETKDGAAGESSNSIKVTDGGFSRSSDGVFFSRNKFILAHNVKRRATVHLHVHNQTGMRQLSLELSCWEV